eukprot:scaffold10273_cov122-Isochrysis_galbana.AAC.9
MSETTLASSGRSQASHHTLKPGWTCTDFDEWGSALAASAMPAGTATAVAMGAKINNANLKFSRTSVCRSERLEPFHIKAVWISGPPSWARTW